MAQKKKVKINYTSRDFNSLKRDLIDYAKRYYPNTYRDFNEASFGSLMMDDVAYIGDILSFYLDYQANESFIDTAVEYNNIKCLKNSPDAIICRNEHIFPDPDARARNELRYLCYRKHMTLSQLKESGKVTDNMLEKLKNSLQNGEDTTLGSDRDSKAMDYGYKENANTKDVERQKIAIIEYYGYYLLR